MYSRYNAGLIKMIFGLDIVRLNGCTLTFGRAFFRALVSKYLGALTCALTIPFRQDRRGIHDLIFNTKPIILPLDK